MQDNFDDLLSSLGDKLRSLALDNLKPDWEEFSEILVEADFDASVKDKLESLSPVIIPEYWDTITSELDEVDFDASIKDKLASFSPAIIAGDWDTINNELDEAPFDTALKAKLQDASIHTGDAGWAIMASQLGPEFDQIMASKLEHAQVEGDTAWPVMEDQLEAPTEAILAERIRNYSIPYSQKAWKQFAPLLDKALPVPATIGFWRTLSLVAALVLLLGLGATLLWKSGLANQSPQDIPASPQAPMADPASPVSPPSSFKQTSPSITETAEESPLEKLNRVPSSLELIFPQAIFIEKSPVASIEGQENKLLTKPTTSQKLTTSTTQGDTDKLTRIESEEAISLLPKDHLAFQQIPRPAKKPLFSGVRIGWSYAAFNTSTRLSDKGTPGYLSGLQIGIPLGSKIELITGIQYGAKHVSREILNSYTPPSIIPNQRSADPVFWRSLLEADYTVIEIPIMLRYAVTDPAKRLSLAFQGGVSGIIIQEVIYRHFNPQSPINSLANNMLELGELKPDIQVQRGGTYWGNFRFAPVVSYRIGKRFDIEAAPYIQLGQQRIGMRQLKLHSIGANASLMIRIGKSSQD